MVPFAFSALGAPMAAPAADTSASFKAGAFVPSNCSVETIRGIAFSNYDPVNAGVEDRPAHLPGENAQLRVRCNRQASPVWLAIDEGLSPSPGSTCTAPARNMTTAAGKRLPYQLAWESGFATPWGCEGAQRLSISFASQSEQLVDVFTALPAGADAAVGDYADTVMVSVAF